MNEPRPEGRPAVSVVIPCRNERAHIEACLRSVLRMDAPEGGFEVIVADGMSDDGTREIIQRIATEDARLRLVDNPKGTTPCGLNVGINAARGDIVVRMDAHTEFAPDYLTQCIRALEETGADNVGGPWIAHGQGYLQRSIAAAFSSPFVAGGARGHCPMHEGPVDTVYLGCWRRGVFNRIGLFDEELVRNQDDELNLRLLRAGGRIWQSPRIRSWYTPRDSLRGLFRQYFQYGYWKVRVVQKHRLPASWRHLVPGTFVAVLALLGAASVVVPLARVAFGALAAVYAVAVLAASVVSAAQAGWDLLPILPAVFACYHFAYGCGWLAGVWDFVVRRRTKGRFVAITR